MDPLLAEVRRRVVEGLRPSTVILFGSRSRGPASPDSDIDLLVIAEMPGSIAERMARAHRLIEGLGVAADVLVFTPEEVERFRHWPGHIVRIALREGVVIHDST